MRLDDFDLVVPLNVADVRWLAKESRFNPRNAIPVPPLDVIDLCDDKQAFVNALTAAGFGSNLSLRTSNLIPYILKRRSDHSSISTVIVRDKIDETTRCALLQCADYCSQRLILGFSEHATHINFMDGRVVSEVTVEYTFATEQSIKFKGRDLYSRYIRCPTLPVFAAMLRTLKYEGLCCFNYKMVDGKPIVFELNPRIGGSLCPLFFMFVSAFPGENKCLRRRAMCKRRTSV